MTSKKIVFLGTPKMSAYLLEQMILKGYNIVGVVTKMDKKGKRGNDLVPSFVAQVCEKYKIPCHKPLKLNTDYQFIEDLKPDLLMTFAFGQILSEKVLSLPKYPPLNIHTSLLPKYRGASPIQFALRDGLTKTGITLIKMVKQMDQGGVYNTIDVDIDPTDNYTSLCEKIKVKAFELVERSLDDFFDNKLPCIEQNEEEATFTRIIKADEEHLSLDLSCTDFINMIRSFTDEIGPYLVKDDESILKIYKASKYDDSTDHKLGEIFYCKKKLILLQLKDGVVNLDRLQKPGKKVLTSVEFNNGNRDLEGCILH